MRSTAQGGPSEFDYIQIGTQQWMPTNLDTANYINGTPIPQVTDNATWASLTTGAWCYYDNDPLNGLIYGKLYNWYAINDINGLVPPGWHVPTSTEWNTLIIYLGGGAAAGGPLKRTGTDYWLPPNTGATNSSGFGILPGGYRQQGTGQFFNKRASAELWTATETPPSSANNITIGYNTTEVITTSYLKTMGFSIRLIRD